MSPNPAGVEVVPLGARRLGTVRVGGKLFEYTAVVVFPDGHTGVLLLNRGAPRIVRDSEISEWFPSFAEPAGPDLEAAIAGAEGLAALIDEWEGPVPPEVLRSWAKVARRVAGYIRGCPRCLSGRD